MFRPPPASIRYLSRGPSCVRPRGVQCIGNEKADSQYNDNSSDSSKHKRPRARSPSVTEDQSAQSKEFHRAVEVRLAPEDFQQQSFSVAARQLNFCSCFGTKHFDLRRAQRGLSSTHRGGVHFIAINFRTRAGRSAKMPAAFCLALPLRGGGGPAPQSRLMTVLGSRASLGNPYAGSRAVSLPGGCAAGNGSNYFCRDAIGGNFAQTCF
jgi:hypothetical protein